MNKPIKIISTLLSLLLICSSLFIVVTAVEPKMSNKNLSYTFANTTTGDAQGVITLTPPNNSEGNCYLFWANDIVAIKGYEPLASFQLTQEETNINMPPHSVIPPDATTVVAFISSSKPNINTMDWFVEKAYAVFYIPKEKQLGFSFSNKLYSFGAISDTQIANDSYGSKSYPYDEQHFATALETLTARGVDFTVSSGDIVNDQNGKQTYAAEYKVYEKILANSSYSKPIYEALGNHDVGTVWNKTDGYYNDNTPFIKATGLDSISSTINLGKPYFEITEPTTGDHFIFMALEGGFYTDRGTQFSTAQLDWLEGLLKKYTGDGNNIFIIEHANIQGWGSGDKLTKPYYYDLGLNPTNSDVSRFIKLMEEYKDCVIITGHTHLELSAQYNYSDNNGTSAVMMHNSAVGGVRRLINGTIDRTAVEGLSEGYIVDVYEKYIIFNGINLTSNTLMPLCSYIISFDNNSTEQPTESQPISSYIYGDCDLDTAITIKDATLIQKHAADMLILKDTALIQADVTADGRVNINDTTSIQRFCVNIISSFPADKTNNLTLKTKTIDEPDFVKKHLDTYYGYSSYDQYMELKAIARHSPDNNTLMQQKVIDLENFLTSIGEPLRDINKPANTTITVYFSNNKYWNKVYAYLWGSSGTKTSWPGETMDFVEENELGESIYSINFNYDDYQKIIFTDGSNQTVDIFLTEETNVGYYISGKNENKYTCETYTYP